MDDLFARQEELENRSTALGRKRYDNRIQTAREKHEGGTVGGARRLLEHVFLETEKVLEDRIEHPGRGRRHTGYKWVDDLGPGTCALIAVREVFASTLKGEADHLQITSMASRIGRALMREGRYRVLREKAPGLFEYRMSSFQTNHKAHMARSLSATLRKASCQECYEAGEQESCTHVDTSKYDNASHRDQVLTGIWLLDAIMAAFPGVFEKKQLQSRSTGKYHSCLVLSTDSLDIIDDRDEILRELHPVTYPMVVPPLPWGPDGQAGGYRYSLRAQKTVAKSSRRHLEEMDRHDLTEVYNALNRIQETPWRVNKDIHRVMLSVAEGGAPTWVLDALDFPRREKITPPARPPHLDGLDRDHPEVYAWRRKAAEAHQEEADRLARGYRWITLKDAVRQVEGSDAFWFPHHLDFRGRIYPIATSLSPQGSDRSKGLLEFADGVPLGEHGLFWLAVHGANCLGETTTGKVNKMTLEERVRMIYGMSGEIRAIARAPEAHFEGWVDADEPFEWLAFCMEWEAAHASGSPETYVSHLPVSVDGTCNGLQHFAAMGQDVRSAKAVNVWPNERPQDVYHDIAESVLDRLERDVSDKEVGAMARAWLASGLVNRSLTKRPTMTFGYGSKAYGMAEQTREYLSSKVAEEDLEALEDVDRGAAVRYIVDLILESLEEVVKPAFELMGWMQECASEIAKAGKVVEWTAPYTNFPVRQDGFTYYRHTSKQVETVLDGVFKPRLATKTGKPAARKQANSVAPNFVHSVDAAALMMTVNRAHGVQHFAMVHDSYGTHAGNMDILLDSTKSSFYQLYASQDVVMDLYHEWLNLVPTLDPPPETGDLDIGVVLASDYFFA